MMVKRYIVISWEMDARKMNGGCVNGRDGGWMVGGEWYMVDGRLNV